MTSYFADHSSQVSEAAGTAMDDKAFLFFISNIEREVIPEINLVTGDREFPDDLREKIQGIIAMHRTTSVGDVQPRQRAVDMATTVRMCPLISELHRAFHEVGTRRHRTRFGILSDNPTVILAMRDDHDNEANDE